MFNFRNSKVSRFEFFFQKNQFSHEKYSYEKLPFAFFVIVEPTEMSVIKVSLHIAIPKDKVKGIIDFLKTTNKKSICRK